VEHFLPKALYPEAVFSWNNYLYACGPCNGPKNDKFSIVATDPVSIISVARKRKELVILPPMVGSPALINPRCENPMDFLFLDLATFKFAPHLEADEVGNARAIYTRETLRLNTNVYVVKQRQLAFGNYLARLEQYIAYRNNNAPLSQLEQCVFEFGKMAHRTVWKEMQRQHSGHPKLASLFIAAPEALAW
jgi:hypothetical protein